jgi:PAS domain S-box-containing protein
MPMSKANWWTNPPSSVKYAVTFVSVASAVIVAWVLWHFWHSEAFASVFFCAIIFSAWFGGFRQGLLGVTVSALAFDYFFLSPSYSFYLDSSQLPRLIIFVVSALIMGFLTASQRSTTESLRRARDDLSTNVQELERTNEELRTENSERKLTQAALRQSQAYLAEAQRLSHTGSWAWTPDTGEIRYLSEECYRVLGFDPHDGQPRSETFFQRLHPDDQAREREIVETARREQAEFEMDYRIVHPGGEIRDIHAVGHPVLSPSGDLVEFVGTVIDITERKRAEEERERLRQARADLAHANRVTTMGELTASVAHEVNQPIAAAVTNAKTCLRWLTRDQPDLEEARAAAIRIVKDGTRAAEIVSRIRSLFKKGATQRELVDANEVIREMVVLLHSEAVRNSISIRTDLATGLPYLMADRVQLQQVLLNLMVNSFDAMKDMEGTRELAIKSQRAENDHVLISVTDTGVGLPPQHADQIFNAFFTTKGQGTGMGLSISRSIIESHGGRLWATGNSGRGATFQFTLPTTVAAREMPACGDPNSLGA